MDDTAPATLSTHLFRHEAEIVLARLAAEGIAAVVRADDEGGLNPGFFRTYGVRVEVRARDLDAARAVIGTEDGSAPSALPEQVVDAVVAHARFAFPDEACGLLAVDGTGAVKMAYCLTNLDRSPYRFTIDPTEHYGAWKHAERNGWEIGGAFHSHPASPAYPSATDVACALDPTWRYVIVGLADPATPDVRMFAIRDGVVSEIADVS
jgi:proteasome lid subunit RPN8/RPN11